MQFRHRLVDAKGPSVRRRLKDPDRCVVKDGPILLHSFPNRLLGLLLFGDVFRRAFMQQDISAGVADRSDTEPQPLSGAVPGIDLDFDTTRRALFGHDLNALGHLRGIDHQRLAGSLRQQLLRRIEPMHSRKRKVDIDEPSISCGLKNPDDRILKHPAILFLGLSGRCFRLLPRSNVIRRYQHGFDSLKVQRMTDNLDVDQFPTLPAVPPESTLLQPRSATLYIRQHLGNIPFRANLEYRLCQKFLPAKPVLPDCRFVHRKKPKRAGVENPHGNRVAFEQQPVLPIRLERRDLPLLLAGDLPHNSGHSRITDPGTLHRQFRKMF